MSIQSAARLGEQVERTRKQRNRMQRIAVIAASIWAATAVAGTVPTSAGGCVATMKLVQTATQLYYDGARGWDGTPQSVKVPAKARCAVTTVVGGGGYSNSADRQGGYGDVVHAAIPVKGGTTLKVLVAGRAGVRGSGGLSGIFSGTPTARTALIVAGGGGTASARTVGQSASLAPIYRSPLQREPGGATTTTSPGLSYPGGAATHAIVAIPYGAGGHVRYLGVSFHGGYGGGSLNWTRASRGTRFDASRRGMSYCAKSIVVCKDDPGVGLGSYGAPSRPGAQAGSGYVTITFYD